MIRSPHHYASFEIGDKAAFLKAPWNFAVLDASDIPGRNALGDTTLVDQPVFAEETAFIVVTRCGYVGEGGHNQT